MLEFQNARFRQGSFEMSANFALTSGVVTALLGPSGSGKSTLLAGAAGFLSPVAGYVFMEGADVTDEPPSQRPMSILFQDGNLFPHLDVATNVALGLSPSGRLNNDQKGAVDAVLERVGLMGMAKRRPAELSGGQQGRAALARVLLRERPVVLLDEPFAALGPGLRFEMLDLVAEHLAGKTVVMVTHAPEDARRIAAEIAFVDQGNAEPPQSTDALLAAPPPALKAYLG